MTKKNYIAFAEVLKRLHMTALTPDDKNRSAILINELIEIFKNDNELFDEKRFRKAITG